MPKIHSDVGHQDVIHSIAFSPNGRQILSGSRDGTARLWDVASGRLLQTFSWGSAKVNAVAWAPDGERIACIRHSDIDEAGEWVPSAVTILDASSLTIERFHVAPAHASFRTIAFSPDGQLVAAAGDDQRIYVWNASDGREVCRIGEPPPAIAAITYSPSGAMLAVGAEDGTAFLCRSNGREIVSLNDSWHATLVHLEFTPSGELLLLASREGMVRLVDVPSLETRLEFRCHEGPLVGGMVVEDGTRFISVGYERASSNPASALLGRKPEIRQWSLTDRRELEWQRLPDDAHITSVAASPDRTRLAISTCREVYMLDAAAESKIQLWLRAPEIMKLAFVENRSRLLVANEGYGMRIADLDRKKSGDWIIATRDGPASLATDARGTVLGRSTAFHKEIELFDTASGRLTKYCLGHRAATNALAISPDGAALVSGSRDGTVRFWETATADLAASILLRPRSNGSAARCRVLSG